MLPMAVVSPLSLKILAWLAPSLFQDLLRKTIINWWFRQLEIIWHRRSDMDLNPVISMLGRRLRLAVIGGGPGSFIGAMHRTAARLDGRYQLVAGVVSSDPERSTRAATAMGIEPARAYVDALAMLDAEVEREDGAEVVAIMTPNVSHHRYAMAALDRGIDVICDK